MKRIRSAATIEKDRLRCAARRAADVEGANRRALDWHRANPERSAAANRNYHQANRATVTARRYRWGIQNKAARRAWRIKADGLPQPTRPAPDNCECCGSPDLRRALALDHCHKTGKFRGWLCMRCNVGIGILGDSVEGLNRARHYLERA